MGEVQKLQVQDGGDGDHPPLSLAVVLYCSHVVQCPKWTIGCWGGRCGALPSGGILEDATDAKISEDCRSLTPEKGVGGVEGVEGVKGESVMHKVTLDP